MRRWIIGCLAFCATLAGAQVFKPGSATHSAAWLREIEAGGGASSGYLIDTYPGAQAACSLRVLSSSFANSDLILARRSSDNAEEGFTASEITDGTLESWAGAGDAFVKTWYDQSGNGNDFTQTTLTHQPIIVSSGVLVATGGLPSVQFDGSDDEIACGIVLVTGQTDRSIFSVVKCDNAADTGFFGMNQGTASVGLVFDLSVESSFYLRVGGNSYYTYSGLQTDLNQWSLIFTGTQPSDALLWQNGTSLTRIGGVDAGLNTANTGGSTIGATAQSSGSAQWFNGDVQEIIVYATNESANRTTIEENINAYYSIY